MPLNIYRSEYELITSVFRVVRLVSAFCLPGVGASEHLNDGSAGREGASDAICE